MIQQGGNLDQDLLWASAIILLVVKASIAIFLGKEVYGKKKRTGKFSWDFLSAVFVLMICLFLSRLLYVIVDFYLVGDNPNNYLNSFTLGLWKMAGLIGGVGFTLVSFIIEKNVFKFKLKGLPSYIILGIFIVVIFLPAITYEEFTFLNFLIIIALLIGMLVPAAFIYKGIQAPEIRKVSILLGIGGILFLSSLILIYFSLKVPGFLLKVVSVAAIGYSASNLFLYDYFTKPTT